MTKKKKKILFGAVDIGWRIEHYSKFINENLSDTLEPYSVVYYKLPANQYKTSYNFEYNLNSKNKISNWFIRFIFFLKALFKFDIFYFLSGETLLTRKLRSFELKIYKILNKQVYFHFVGSDIRSPKYIDWKTQNIHKYLEGEDTKKTEFWQDKLISDAKKYAKKIFVSTPDLLSIIKDSLYIPVFIDLKKFNQELNNVKRIEKNKNVVYILHAPSNPRLKGTLYIENIMNKIKNDYNEDVELLLPKKRGNNTYSTTRYELFQLYQQADIVIDQMIIGWYGLQAIEALSSKNIVISYIDKDLERYLFPKCPIKNANVNTLEDVLKESIEEIRNKAIDYEKQIEWVKQYHTIENNKFLYLQNEI